MSSASPRVVLITDPRYSDEHVDGVIRVVAGALGPGLLLVQLRDKGNEETSGFRKRAEYLRRLTTEVGALFVVNGPVAVARAAGADGLHVPDPREVSRVTQALGAGAICSTSAHDDDDVRRATSAGASLLLVSPIYETPGEHKAKPRGEEALRRARAILDEASAGASRGSARPLLFALGGVDQERAMACERAGADGVAVIRAVLDADTTEVASIARALTLPFRVTIAR